MLLQGAGGAGIVPTEQGALTSTPVATAVTCRYIEQDFTTNATRTLYSVDFHCEGQAAAQTVTLLAADRTTVLATSAALSNAVTGLNRFTFAAPVIATAASYCLRLDRGSSVANGKFGSAGFANSGIVSAVGNAFYGDTTPPANNLGTGFRTPCKLIGTA